MHILDLKALVLVFLALDFVSIVQAAVYVLQPSEGSVCHGGQECTIQWTDDGESPLLSAVGVVNIGLYHGNMQLVQSIPPTNVAEAQSVTFTPISEAGPNSKRYYIALTSTSEQVNGSAYVGYSPFFELDGMSGTFSSPLDSATQSIPIPSSLSAAASDTNTVLSTRTIGTPSTELPSISVPSASLSSLTPSLSSTLSAPSGFSSSRVASSASVASSQSASASAGGATSSNGASRTGYIHISLPVIGVLSLCVLFL